MTAFSNLTTGKILVLTILLGIFAGCENKPEKTIEKTPVAEKKLPLSERIFYHVFVPSFFDSNGDEIGDIVGVGVKLKYLQALGVNGLLLSSLNSTQGIDGDAIQNYRKIAPQLGSQDDLKKLLAEAEKNDIVVLLNLKMPDLNFDNQAARDSVKSLAKFWLDIGVDGFCIDDALRIYPHEGDNREQNLWKTISWWEEFSKFVKITNPSAILIGNVPAEEEVVAEFSKSGFDANFNYQLAENITEIISDEKDDKQFAKSLSDFRDNSVFSQAEFDDIIFSATADQDRLGSRVDGDTSKIKLAASILLTLPGTPILRYGEEIGLLGQQSDSSTREPIVWYAPGSGSGQTAWQSIIHNHKTEPASLQFDNPNSILNHYKKLAGFRKNEPLITSGEFSWLGFDGQPESLTGYMFRKGNEHLMVFHNLAPKTIEFDWFPMTKEGIALIHRGAVEGEKDKSKITVKGFGTVVLKSKR